MIDQTTAAHLLLRALPLAGWLLLGTLVGVIHFSVLRRGTELMAQARGGLALLLLAARFALTGGVLAAAAVAGSAPLLATAVGLMFGRAVVLGREERRPS